MIHGKYQCQWCGREVLIVVDETGGRKQEWVEDCEFCCRPNVLDIIYDPETEEVEIESRREND